MDGNGVNEPLLPEPAAPMRESTKKLALRRKRCRRSRSNPDLLPADIHAFRSVPLSGSILGRLRSNFRTLALLLSMYLGVGTICFYLSSNQIKGKKTDGIIDALYFCIVTMTTVGYGDLVPDTILTKLLACAFVFMGMALVALTLSKAADYLVEKQEILLIKALNADQKFGPTEMLKEIETKRVRYKTVVAFVVLVILIVVGTVFLVVVEDLALIDAFYCVCSTITTLGYGDESFSTPAGRAFAVLWILTSTVCLAQFYLYIAELNTEERQRSLAKWALTRRVTNEDLEAADLDSDGVVDPAEFIVYKLKELGKVTEEDIALIMEEFEDLDVDLSGTLTSSDIMIAQSQKDR